MDILAQILENVGAAVVVVDCQFFNTFSGTTCTILQDWQVKL